MQLTEELTSTENKVAFSRQAFNDQVTEYNTYRASFPPILFASLFGHPTDAELLNLRFSRNPSRAKGFVLILHELFQAQDKARGKTRLLTLLFIAAVVSLVVLTNLLVAVAIGVGVGPEALAAQPPETWLLIVAV